MSGDPARWRPRFATAVGSGAIMLLFCGLAAWGVGTEISGAVMAPGTVEVQRERQVIQHPDGGVVAEIRARDGDRVAAGDILLRLDGTFLRSELAIVESQLAEIFARSARLRAERDGRDLPDFEPPPALSTVGTGAIAELVAGQLDLFRARRASLARDARHLSEQQRQIARQIDGLTAQLAALDRQRGLIAGEIADVEALFDRGLVPATRLLQLRREDARLQGERGRLTASVAEAETRISTLSIETARLSDTQREEAIARLRDLGYRRIELQERRLSLVERIARLDVRAPVAGTVFASSVAAERSVVRAAQPMMFIIPGDGPLQVSARVDPTDIDQVFPGQEVALMFTAFSRRITPDIPGTVLRVSADAETDDATGQSYYQAVILPDGPALARMPELQLMPGMPVESFLKTQDRTPLSYLTQPLTAYFQRAFREE